MYSTIKQDVACVFRGRRVNFNEYSPILSAERILPRVT